MRDFADRLLAWFDAHGRKDLPWQKPDPYCVWVSEIMLQQTQVRTVIPYFERFMASFPTVIALADADLDSVLQHWSGLGYYARARNMHKAARLIRDAHDGRFPNSFDDIAALPGIGRSTAGAISSLAFDVRKPILDGNVKRVLARHQAIAGWPAKSSVARALWEAADRATPSERVGDYTQAIMDLGATICTRSKPSCATCPVADDCAARIAGSVEQFPGRKPRKAKPRKQTTMVIAVSGGAVYLERRPPAGIWGGLWSLPEVASGDVNAWCEATSLRADGGTETLDTLRHSFSHYDLDIQPVVVRINGASRKVADDANVRWYQLDSTPPGGIAAPVRQLIETVKTDLNVPND